MPKYNTTFDLSLDDMDLIETALRTATEARTVGHIDPRAVNDLLGRLHNQKVFYRPPTGTYISG